jgi:hypothetical protein
LSIMNEIGYHNCDWVSFEAPKHLWGGLVDELAPWPLELHVPCRDPIDHLMSQCNYLMRTFDCTNVNITRQVERCILDPNRYGDSLGLHKNITLKCFNPIPIEPYLDYMTQFLRHVGLLNLTFTVKLIGHVTKPMSAFGTAQRSKKC